MRRIIRSPIRLQFQRIKPMILFRNIEQSIELLISNKIDISSWGKCGAKTIQDLWAEINSGESQIQDNPVMRILPVTQLIIRNASGMILVETEQVFADGRTRHRNIPPSEKMKLGENFSSSRTLFV